MFDLRPHKTFFLFLLSIFLFHFHLSAQNQSPFQTLNLSNDKLRDNIFATETVLDLVQASVEDSVIHKQKQRLKGLGGWMLQRLFTRYWTILDSNKRKYVGSSSRPYKIYDGVGDEVDINIFIMPHLPAYIDMATKAFDEARQRPRGDNGFRFDSIPGFPLPEELKYEDRGYLTIECELTPPELFRDKLDKTFLPMEEGPKDLSQYPNFGQKNPSFGMTGAWCMDCNHNCRPEIHPIEWLWWLDLSENPANTAHTKHWMLSLMHDDSHRFDDWSQSPMKGSIAIPFVVEEGTNSLNISLELIAADPLQNSEPQSFHEGRELIPTNSKIVPLARPNGGLLNVKIEPDSSWKNNNFSYSFSELKQDPNSKLMTGYFRIFVDVSSIFAARITTNYPTDN